MKYPKEYKKPDQLKKQLIRLRQSVPGATVMTVDKFIGRVSGVSEVPYSFSNQISSPSYFILGSGRSGNTLLRRLLMENFDTFIPPEIPGLGKCMRGIVRNRYRGWDFCSRSFFSSFEASANVDVLNPENDLVYNLWNEVRLSINDLMMQAEEVKPEAQSGAALISLLYKNILDNSDIEGTFRTVIGDKTPWNVMYTHQIEAFFPNSKFAIIVRHPLAVINSYVRSLAPINGITLEEAARRWSRAQKNCLDLAHRVGSDRFKVVQYETLVTSKNESLRIGNFLGLCERKGSKIPKGISQADAKLLQHKRINQDVDSSSIRTWKGDISGGTKERLIEIVKPAVDRLASELGIDYRGDF